MTIAFRFLPPILLSLLLAITAYAQKLPNKQETSVWIPPNTKIDGKTTEWDDKFQASNHSTDILYTMANDDKNLYLVTYITEPNAIFYKAMTGGITLVIKNGGQKVSVRYPVFQKTGLPPTFPRLSRNQVLTGIDDDPVIVKDNAVLADKANEIEVVGVKEIDTLISIYNEYNIKVAGRFDVKQGYVYELIIPFKYLGLTEGANFSYQLLVNGGPNKYVMDDSRMPRITGGRRADGTDLTAAEIDAGNARMAVSMAARYAATDFSAEYTLAKKP